MTIDSGLYPMTLNGVDFSGDFCYLEQDERKRKVYGPNSGRVTMSGKKWINQIAVKHDLTARTMPMSPAKLKVLSDILDEPYITQTYFSFHRNAIVTRKVIVAGADAIIGMIRNVGTELVLRNIPIFFEEQ